MLNEIYFARQNHRYTSETRCIFAMSAKCTCSRINVMIAFASERECTLNGWIVKITPGFPIRFWIGAIASEISKRIIRLTDAMYKLHTLYAFHFAIRKPDRNIIKCCAHSVLNTLNNVDNFTSGQLFLLFSLVLLSFSCSRCSRSPFPFSIRTKWFDFCRCHFSFGDFWTKVTLFATHTWGWMSEWAGDGGWSKRETRQRKQRDPNNRKHFEIIKRN